MSKTPKTSFKLPKQVKTKWVKALRSGKYEQGHGQLRTDSDFDFNNDGTIKCQFCVLGVAREIGIAKICDIDDEDPDFFVNQGFLPIEIQKFLSNKNDGATGLFTQKGSGAWSFKKLATWIEKNL